MPTTPTIPANPAPRSHVAPFRLFSLSFALRWARMPPCAWGGCGFLLPFLVGESLGRTLADATFARDAGTDCLFSCFRLGGGASRRPSPIGGGRTNQSAKSGTSLAASHSDIPFRQTYVSAIIRPSFMCRLISAVECGPLSLPPLSKYQSTDSRFASCQK